MNFLMERKADSTTKRLRGEAKTLGTESGFSGLKLPYEASLDKVLGANADSIFGSKSSDPDSLDRILSKLDEDLKGAEGEVEKFDRSDSKTPLAEGLPSWRQTVNASLSFAMVGLSFQLNGNEMNVYGMGLLACGAALVTLNWDALARLSDKVDGALARRRLRRHLRWLQREKIRFEKKRLKAIHRHEIKTKWIAKTKQELLATFNTHVERGRKARELMGRNTPVS